MSGVAGYPRAVDASSRARTAFSIRPSSSSQPADRAAWPDRGAATLNANGADDADMDTNRRSDRSRALVLRRLSSTSKTRRRLRATPRRRKERQAPGARRGQVNRLCLMPSLFPLVCPLPPSSIRLRVSRTFVLSSNGATSNGEASPSPPAASGSASQHRRSARAVECAAFESPLRRRHVDPPADHARIGFGVEGAVEPASHRPAHHQPQHSRPEHQHQAATALPAAVRHVPRGTTRPHARQDDAPGEGATSERRRGEHQHQQQ